ncbi:hypothetical protein KIPB_016376, partial [Kipferlia bialata]
YQEEHPWETQDVIEGYRAECRDALNRLGLKHARLVEARSIDKCKRVKAEKAACKLREVLYTRPIEYESEWERWSALERLVEDRHRTLYTDAPSAQVSPDAVLSTKRQHEAALDAVARFVFAQSGIPVTDSVTAHLLGLVSRLRHLRVSLTQQTREWEEQEEERLRVC